MKIMMKIFNDIKYFINNCYHEFGLTLPFIQDMIIVNGMNVYPRMVEEVLYRFEQINEAAVVGEAHPSHGEIPVAFITLKEGTTATAAELRAFCLKSLGVFQVPKKFIFMNDLPKTATGKILKRELNRKGEVERGVLTQ